MKPTTISAAAAGLLLPLASATGSGTQGLITENDIHRSSSIKVMKTSSMISTSGSTTSRSVGECLTPTTAKYEDCVNALGDLRAYPGNVTLQNNTCLNWWEGSCLVKVCAVQGRYSGNAAQIADTMTAMLLDPCIKQGKSGVESDCANVNGQCGAYRYWLTEYGGDFDWAV